ncbi:hypothetical protein FKM82_026251 [Ascaphus truei]
MQCLCLRRTQYAHCCHRCLLTRGTATLRAVRCRRKGYSRKAYVTHGPTESIEGSAVSGPQGPKQVRFSGYPCVSRGAVED